MNKFVLNVLVAFAVLGLLLQSGAPVMAAAKKATVKNVVKKAPVKKVVITKKVLGKNKKGQPIYSYSYSSVPANPTVNCNMPDGKTIKVLKSVCDEVTAFWAKNKPSGGSSNNGGGSSNNSNNNNGGGSNSNPEPGLTISDYQYMGCGSASCVSTKTFRVRGTKFTSNARFELVDSTNKLVGVNTTFYSNPDATLVGQTPTELIMDFHNLPCGATYGVQVVDSGKTVSWTNFKLLIPCI